MKKLLENELYIRDIDLILSNFDWSGFNGKTILITGGLGLIGSSITDLLVEYNIKANAKIKIYIADINEAGFSVRYGGFSFVEYIPYDAVKPVQFDFAVDFIIHCAGLASPELYVLKPVETMLSNFNGVLNLLEYARKNNVERMLYISSSEVYGVKDEMAAFEENKFGVVNINTIRSSYSEAKRASEVLCKSFSAEYNVSTVIVRPGHIYGPTASPRDKRISSEFSYLAAQGKDLEMKSSGIQKRSYCYSLDCAAAILIALINGETGESYNVGNDEVTSIKEMSEILAKAGNVSLKAKEPTKEESRQFNPMNNSSLDNKKIKSIGYKDSFSVYEGLTHTVEILKELL